MNIERIDKGWESCRLFDNVSLDSLGLSTKEMYIAQ